MNENTHGGKRDGAGRKPAPEGEKKETLCVRLSPDVIEYLKQAGAGVIIEAAIRRTKAFKEWEQG